MIIFNFKHDQKICICICVSVKIIRSLHCHRGGLWVNEGCTMLEKTIQASSWVKVNEIWKGFGSWKKNKCEHLNLLTSVSFLIPLYSSTCKSTGLSGDKVIIHLSSLEQELNFTNSETGSGRNRKLNLGGGREALWQKNPDRIWVFFSPNLAADGTMRRRL